MSGWSALVAPSLARGRGTGHLKRCAGLAGALRSLGAEAYLYLGTSGPDDFSPAEVRGLLGAEPPPVFSGPPEGRNWTLAVLDRFRTDPDEFRRWSAVAPLVGLDEGGPCRAAFDFLLDLLPALPGAHRPNLTAPEFLDAPARRRESFPRGAFSGEKPLRVLVSFGGEDAAGLSVPAAAALAADPRVSVDLLRGPLASFAAPGGRVRLLEGVPDLRERLADYDLAVTQYGLTAFEAARARVPVLLVSPTRYHQALSRAAGFVSAGVGAAAASRAARYLGSLDLLAERTAAAAPADAAEPDRPLARFLAALSFPSGASCPLCGSRPGPASAALARFRDRSYRRCASCGLVFMTRAAPPGIAYGKDYFFEDYRRQYGKTYLEDFPHLEAVGAVRAARVASLLDASGDGGRPAVLDVGCAYGPFLSAAGKAGFDAYGVDPAADAVRHVRETLGLPAAEGLFPGFDPGAAFGVRSFDALTLWYVVEHFPGLDAALRAAASLVRPGGVLAFSTPSGGGVSARVRPRDFYEKSPADHYSIWEPRACAGLLRRYGFRLEKIVVTGHHPERFPGLSRARSGGLRHRAALAASRLLGLGDTFEAYAVKE